jgi:hypothetical protein
MHKPHTVMIEVEDVVRVLHISARNPANAARLAVKRSGGTVLSSVKG